MRKASSRDRHKHHTDRQGGAARKPPSSGPSLRDSGIRPLGLTAWGAHICLFYETRDDLLDAVVTYFDAGLRNNEYCVWAISGPITLEDAEKALRAYPVLARCLDAGQIELMPGEELYLQDDAFDLKKAASGSIAKLEQALARGFDGLRAAGSNFRIAAGHWSEFREYEMELDRALEGQKVIALCTYDLSASSAADILDVARVHQFSLARRQGKWEFLETPELRQAKREIARLSDAIGVLSRPFPGHDKLTASERVTLAQIVKGATNKEAARELGLSPRTVEFHRANIMQKLGTKNAAELVRKVLDH